MRRGAAVRLSALDGPFSTVSYTAEKAVREMGVESAPGQGCTVWLTLPAPSAG